MEDYETPHQLRKKVIEPRDERHQEKEINRPFELKIVIWGSLAIFFIVTVYALLRNDDSKDWSSAQPGTIGLNSSKKSGEDAILIELYDTIQPEEANAIVIAYMKLHTGHRPSMALRSALPTKDGTSWTMDLYYLDKELETEYGNRQVLVHKSSGDVQSEGMPSMTLPELADQSELRVAAE